MQGMPLAQIVGPFGGKIEWAIPIGVGGGQTKDSISFKDTVSFWETFQCLGDGTGKSLGEGVGPLSQAATFEQILANWEFRGKAGKNTTLEDVVNYAVSRWRKQPKNRKMKKKSRGKAQPYPSSKTLREKMKKNRREKANRQKVNEKFEALGQVVRQDTDSKMEKSSLLSEAIRVIEALRLENKKLEKEKADLHSRCQSVSRCLSAGLAAAAAEEAHKRHRRIVDDLPKRPSTSMEDGRIPSPPMLPSFETSGPSHLVVDQKNFSIPPPPQVPIPNISTIHSQPRRHSRRQSDALRQMILSQRRNLGNDAKNAGAFFGEFYLDVDNKRKAAEACPMEDIDFTFKPMFDNVLSQLPKPDSFDELVRPSIAKEMCFDSR
ncbi:hypothetical protein AAMO2058_000999300 [Amorphochlora amoebiformis]